MLCHSLSEVCFLPTRPHLPLTPLTSPPHTSPPLTRHLLYTPHSPTPLTPHLPYTPHPSPPLHTSPSPLTSPTHLILTPHLPYTPHPSPPLHTSPLTPHLRYLNTARHCDNPKCLGVYFESSVQTVKFTDFCGKYRVPFQHYLCSSDCSADLASPSPSSSPLSSPEELMETDTIAQSRMRKVLLG